MGASVEKGAKLDREGKRKLVKKAGEDHTSEELTEEKEMKTEATAKTEREAKHTKKSHAERNAKAVTEAEAFQDAANAFGDGSEAAAKERERLRKIAKAEREKKAAKAADKAREASLAAKVEHIKKMRAEHKEKASREYTELDKSKKEEEQRTEKERQDIWGTKLGAAGVAVMKTVDMGLDDAAAEAKAAEEEKVHSVKQSERDGKTKREAALVK